MATECVKKEATDDINDLLNKLCLKDEDEVISVKFEKLKITAKNVDNDDSNSENGSLDDSGYEDNKDEKSAVDEPQTNSNIILAAYEHQKPVEPEDGEIPSDKSNNTDDNELSEKSDENTDEDYKELKKEKCHQDLIITGDKKDTDKEDIEKEDAEKDKSSEQNESLDDASKTDKDVEDSGYIRRTGKTMAMTPNYGDVTGQNDGYYNMTKPFTIEQTNTFSYTPESDYMNSPQSFSPYIVTSDSSNSMQNFSTSIPNQGYVYSDSPNHGLWYDSPQSSPSPYLNDVSKKEFRSFSQDSEEDLFGHVNSYILTPPPSVSPTKQFLEGSPYHQSCLQIADQIDLTDKEERSSLGGSAPQDELNNLLSALGCEEDNSLWDMNSFIGGKVNDQEPNFRMDDMPIKGMQYQEDRNVKVSKLRNDLFETDSNEFGIYLSQNLNLEETERRLLSNCDAGMLFELESRIASVLSNNPMAIIPDDQHGDTNLIVLSSRDEDKRDKIEEKIYALSKGLSNVGVCCNTAVENCCCVSCGNSNPEAFHTPLTLNNVQGYTALSCAVIKGYPSIIVEYLVALIQRNKLDVQREFCGDRNKLYISYEREYPFLSKFASEYAPISW